MDLIRATNGGVLARHFPHCGEKDDFDEILIMEDLKLIPVMNAIVNERIKAQYEKVGSSTKAFDVGTDDISGYIIIKMYLWQMSKLASGIFENFEALRSFLVTKSDI